jgi:hypothetical protein
MFQTSLVKITTKNGIESDDENAKRISKFFDMLPKFYV